MMSGVVQKKIDWGTKTFRLWNRFRCCMKVKRNLETMSGSTWSKVVTKTCYTGRCWIVVGGLKGGRLGGWDSCELLRSRDGNLMSLGGKFYVAGKNPRLCVRKINEKRSGWLSGGAGFFWIFNAKYLNECAVFFDTCFVKIPCTAQAWNLEFSVLWWVSKRIRLKPLYKSTTCGTVLCTTSTPASSSYQRRKSTTELSSNVANSL